MSQADRGQFDVRRGASPPASSVSSSVMAAMSPVMPSTPKVDFSRIKRSMSNNSGMRFWRRSWTHNPLDKSPEIAVDQTLAHRSASDGDCRALERERKKEEGELNERRNSVRHKKRTSIAEQVNKLRWETGREVKTRSMLQASVRASEEKLAALDTAVGMKSARAEALRKENDVLKLRCNELKERVHEIMQTVDDIEKGIVAEARTGEVVYKWYMGMLVENEDMKARGSCGSIVKMQGGQNGELIANV